MKPQTGEGKTSGKNPGHLPPPSPVVGKGRDTGREYKFHFGGCRRSRSSGSHEREETVVGGFEERGQFAEAGA